MTETSSAACVACGRSLVPREIFAFHDGARCSACYSVVTGVPEADVRESRGLDPAASTVRDGAIPVPILRAAEPDAGGGSAAACLVIGLASLAVGLWYLFNPGVPVEMPDLSGLGIAAGTREVVNMQRLAIGQTLTLAGAVFVAAALRPRGR